MNKLQRNANRMNARRLLVYSNTSERCPVCGEKESHFVATDNGGFWTCDILKFYIKTEFGMT